MKKLNFLLCLSLVCLMCNFSSCSKGGDSPVDKYVEVIDQATKNAKNLKSLDYAELQSLISPETAQQIASEFQDYQLTEKDKKKLKKSCDSFMEVLYDKLLEYSEIPDEYKDQIKSQRDLVISALNQKIDAAETLGDIDHVN
ncbi:MAG: hypothetical protein J1F38_05900 [Muribaculaceae bacterium]|nr:hypothetical protein [Muribaculaceae bacterium]